jgi:hypothetical protein
MAKLTVNGVVTEMKIPSPFLSVMPRSLWEELHPVWSFESAFQRKDDLSAAVLPFIRAGLWIEWLDEREEINQRIYDEARWYCDPTGIMRSPLFRPVFRLFGFKGYRLPIENNSLQ